MQIATNDLNNEIIEFLETFIRPKIFYASDFKQHEYHSEICEIFRKVLKQSALKLVKCNDNLEDVVDRDQQTQLIQLAHDTETNHRGITETELDEPITYNLVFRMMKKNMNNCGICQIIEYYNLKEVLESQPIFLPKI